MAQASDSFALASEVGTAWRRSSEVVFEGPLQVADVALDRTRFGKARRRRRNRSHSWARPTPQAPINMWIRPIVRGQRWRIRSFAPLADISRGAGRSRGHRSRGSWAHRALKDSGLRAGGGRVGAGRRWSGSRNV